MPKYFFHQTHNSILDATIYSPQTVARFCCLEEELFGNGPELKDDEHFKKLLEYFGIAFYHAGQNIYEIHPHLIKMFENSHLKGIQTKEDDVFLLRLPSPTIALRLESSRFPWKEIILMERTRQGQPWLCILLLDIDPLLQTAQSLYLWIDLSKETVEECFHARGAYGDAIAAIVGHCILYINNGTDILWHGGADENHLKEKIARCTNPKKKKRLEEHLKHKQGVYQVGYKTVLSREAKEIYKGDEQGKWKLTRPVKVQGHWTHQPYGKNRGSRKLLWIKPYWKGPDGEYFNSIHVVK